MTPRTKSRATAIDHLVGMRLKECRKLLKITVSEVAQVAGVSFQQILKYENSSNRVPIARLWHIAQFMGKPIQYFVSPSSADDESNDGEQKKNFCKLRELVKRIFVRIFM